MSEGKAIDKIDRIMGAASKRSTEIVDAAADKAREVIAGIADAGERNRVRAWCASKYAIPVPPVADETPDLPGVANE